MASRLSLLGSTPNQSVTGCNRHRCRIVSWADGDRIRCQFGMGKRQGNQFPTANPLVPKAGKVSVPFQFPKEGEEGAERISVLTKIKSDYNDIVMVDTPKNRVLLLDSTNNISSMINKDEKLTGSYWDECATLPAVIPQGPIAILGLGAGTAARVMLDLWPSLQLEGWEIDELLVDKAREYFGLSDLEKHTEFGGFLSINIGDALSPSASIEGRLAGIIVDLFVGGEVLPQLNKVETWLELQKRLLPNGRLMVNCGGFNFHREDGSVNPIVLADGSWIPNATIKALCQAFPNQVWWKRLAEKEGHNYLALTGPAPDLNKWSAAVPEQLSANVNKWKPCELAEREPCFA